MVKPFEDMQRMNQAGVDAAMKAMGEWGKSWQAIAAEMTDYTKRSFEDGTQTLEKLMSAKSMEQAFEIQSTYAKRAYDDYMQQMSKLGTMYSELAKEAYRPMERAMQGGR
ncbi:MAG: phasin family protein [Hyphomicrobiaceae bacterium]